MDSNIFSNYIKKFFSEEKNEIFIKKVSSFNNKE